MSGIVKNIKSEICANCLHEKVEHNAGNDGKACGLQWFVVGREDWEECDCKKYIAKRKK